MQNEKLADYEKLRSDKKNLLKRCKNLETVVKSQTKDIKEFKQTIDSQTTTIK